MKKTASKTTKSEKTLTVVRSTSMATDTKEARATSVGRGQLAALTAKEVADLSDAEVRERIEALPSSERTPEIRALYAAVTPEEKKKTADEE